MKIELTDEQRQKMTAVFAAINEVKRDKQMIKLMQYLCSSEFDEVKAVREDILNTQNEDDYARLVNFYDDLRDTAQQFDFWEE